MNLLGEVCMASGQIHLTCLTEITGLRRYWLSPGQINLGRYEGLKAILCLPKMHHLCELRNKKKYLQFFGIFCPHHWVCQTFLGDIYIRDILIQFSRYSSCIEMEFLLELESAQGGNLGGVAGLDITAYRLK